MSEGADGLVRDKTCKPGRAPLPPEIVAQVVELTLLHLDIPSLSLHLHESWVLRQPPLTQILRNADHGIAENPQARN
jgi:hypothetical protein